MLKSENERLRARLEISERVDKLFDETMTRIVAERDSLRKVTAELKDMVRRAYNDGFGEGIKEHTTHKGGNPWHMSKWPAAIAKAESQK
jgi:regulator of replication initiation timing